LLNVKSENHKIIFEAFVGVGPRSFFNLFSTNLGSGYAISRKENNSGETIEWKRQDASVRMPLLAIPYLEREISLAEDLEQLVSIAQKKDQ